VDPNSKARQGNRSRVHIYAIDAAPGNHPAEELRILDLNLF
jgi:hypothetical protein